MLSNSIRVSKNALLLCFRQLIIMLVSLYTVRIILETLGAEDYGIYNVISSVIIIFGFFNGTITEACQRYFSFYLGKNNLEHLEKIFNICFIIFIFVGLIILLLGETLGLWFVSSKLTIPQERYNSALIVYQLSILSFLFTFLANPYMAMIIAREDIHIYAYMSIVDVLLKVGIIFLLRFITMDKLILYSLLMAVIALVNAVIYILICNIKYKECKFSLYWNKEIFIDIISYTGWNTFGGIAIVSKIQLVNIILNQFFNPIVIAARNISFSLNNVILSFFNSFAYAINPQIIKSFSSGNEEKTERIMYQCAKFNYFIMYLLITPIIIKAPCLLSIWLEELPDYTIIFSRFLLMDTLINSPTIFMVTLIMATGKVKWFNIIIQGILILNSPLSFVVLLIGFKPYFVYIIALILTITTFVLKIVIINNLFHYSFKKIFYYVIFPILLATLFSLPALVLISLYIKQLLLSIIIICLFNIICIYILGLNKDEKKLFGNIIYNFIKNKRP